jgi:DNA-binding SARP family transcriptional activator
MRFRLLGPLEVIDDQGHPVAIGGLKPRTLLAVLLLHANQPVATDELMDALWG